MIRHRSTRKAACIICIFACMLFLSAWGPSREMSDYYDPNTHSTSPRFNSTFNNPITGFTPDFTGIREAGTSEWTDQISLEPGKTYDVFGFYENDALSGTCEAINATMQVNFPAIIRAGEEVKGRIDILATNAEPQLVWSTITFANDWEGDMLLRYVPNSAKMIYSNTTYPDGAELPNGGSNLFSLEGQLIGNSLDGKVAAGSQGYIQFQIVADYPNFEIYLSMQKPSTKKWANTISVSPGERIWVSLKYKNTGSILQNDVVLMGLLPAGMAYVPTSSYLVNSNHPAGLAIGDQVTTEGINVGTYAPGEAAEVFFQVEIKDSPFSTLEILPRIETNNASKEATAGLVKVENLFIIDSSMDNPITYLLVATISAFAVTFSGILFGHHLDRRKEKRQDSSGKNE